MAGPKLILPRFLMVEYGWLKSYSDCRLIFDAFLDRDQGFPQAIAIGTDITPESGAICQHFQDTARSYLSGLHSDLKNRLGAFQTPCVKDLYFHRSLLVRGGKESLGPTIYMQSYPLVLAKLNEGQSPFCGRKERKIG
jgi:hypothetical protein